MQGDKALDRERVHPCNVCDKAFKSLKTPNQHTLWQHSGHVFVCKGCGKNFSRKSSLSKQMLVVHGASRPSKILQDGYLAKL